MSKISWFYNRLKAMSIAEITHRVKKIFIHKINRIKYKNNAKVYDLIQFNIDIDKIYNNLECIFKKIDVNSIDIDIVNEYTIFNDNINLEKSINWHKGKVGEWDNKVSSYDIEFKNSDNIGDIRYSWEINRHQFMPSLAIKYLKTNDYKYIELIENHFEDWVESNMFLKGINWSSPMEIALRAYQWLVVLYLLKDIENIALKDKLIKSITASISYVMDNLSLYSSANNHLILEVAISSIVGYCVGDVYKQDWMDKGYEILKSEIPKQFYEDGVNKEQALHYQAFVTDMMLQYNSMMKNISIEPIEDNLIKKSVEFIRVLNAHENYIDFGDSDDAKILTFGNRKYNYYEYVLDFASNYYNKDFYINKDNYSEISLFCKISSKIKRNELKNIYTYENGGYSVIRNNDNILIFDFGDLGFGNIAAHGHADALMFMYYYKNNPFFVDSGTYIYNVDSRRRNYFRGTEAHSTLCYMGENQSQIKGPFLWGKKSKTTLLNINESSEEHVLQASNDGYSPSVHTRKIKYTKTNDLIEIKDYFDSEAELNFILDEKVKVINLGGNIFKLINNKAIYMYVDGEVKIERTEISNKFLEIKYSNKIKVKYSFIKEHLTLICPDINLLNRLIEERKSNIEIS